MKEKMEKRKKIQSSHHLRKRMLRRRALKVSSIVMIMTTILAVVEQVVKSYQKKACHGMMWRSKQKKRIDLQLAEGKLKVLCHLHKIEEELVVEEEAEDELVLPKYCERIEYYKFIMKLLLS